MFLLINCIFRTYQTKNKQKNCKRYYDKAMHSFVYTSPDEMPEYPGSLVKFYSFLSKNTIYPIVKENEVIQSKVLLTFIVDTLGNARALAIHNKPMQYYSPLDISVLNAAKQMKKWKPGKCNGKKVFVRVNTYIIITPQI